MPEPSRQAPTHEDGAQTPSISAVVATWNAVSSLRACLASVIGQSQMGVELVVIDGGSTDGTVELIDEHAAAIAYWESEADRGIYHAWNKALDHVSGQWVYFLGADDVLASSSSLEQVVDRLSGLPAECSVAYGAVRRMNTNGEIGVAGRPWHDAESAFFDGSMLPHQGTFHRRSLFDRVGRFDESYRICGDYELLLRELPHYAPAYLEDVIVADTASDGISGRRDMFPLVLRELHRARRTHGYAVSTWRDGRQIRALTHAYLMRWFGRDAANRVGNTYRRLTRRG